MAVIKRRVLDILAEYLRPILRPEVPDTDVIVEDPGSERTACWPHVLVRQIGPFELEIFEEDELWSTSTTRAVQVGDMRGQIEIVIGSTNKGQREELEDRILNAFLGFEGEHDGLPRPGVVVQQMDGFTVGGKAALKAVPIAYVLQTETWQEEMVFEKKRFSSLMLDVDMPAIVIREGVPDIQELVIAITDDLASANPTQSDVQLSVSEDGDVTQYP